MCLWLTETSQRITVPSFQVGRTGWSTLTATSSSLLRRPGRGEGGGRLDVLDQRLELTAGPAGRDGRHEPGDLRVVPSLGEERRQALRVDEGRVPGDRGPDVALAGQAVALRTDALPGLLPEIGGPGRPGGALGPEPLVELGSGHDLDLGPHDGVLDAAELGALAPEGAGLRGGEGQLVRATGNRVALAGERR